MQFDDFVRTSVVDAVYDSRQEMWKTDQTMLTNFPEQIFLLKIAKKTVKLEDKVSNLFNAFPA